MEIKKATAARIIKKAEARETERALLYLQEHWEEFIIEEDSEPDYLNEDSIKFNIDYWLDNGH